MIQRATLAALLTASAFSADAQPVESVTVSTSTVTTTVYQNGNIGGACDGSVPAFVYKGEEGLCSSGVLVGLGDGDVIGNSYYLTTQTGWTPFIEISPATSAPYPGFPNGYRLIYENAGLGADVFHFVYYGETYPDVILHEFEIYSSGSDPTVYLGLHHDWDVGGSAFASNLGARDGTTLYATDPTGITNTAFGLSLLTDELSGWRFDTEFAGDGQTNELDESILWNGLTVPGLDSAPGQDQRFVSGVGPIDLSLGFPAARLVALYAAGDDVDDLLANIAEVTTAIAVAADEPLSGSPARLSPPFPNPSSAAARLTVELDAAERVHVSIVDLLGREVTVVNDGHLAAGSTHLDVPTAELAPGLYLVRARGESFSAARRLTVSR